MHVLLLRRHILAIVDEVPFGDILLQNFLSGERMERSPCAKKASQWFWVCGRLGDDDEEDADPVVVSSWDLDENPSSLLIPDLLIFEYTATIFIC